MPERVCLWCGAPMERRRRDALTCGQSCRQARARYARHRIEVARAKEPRSWAYADPPYPGKAHLYRGHPDYAGEVDHAELLSRLQGYDGWALSTSSAAVVDLIALAVDLGIEGLSVAPWVRGELTRGNRGPSDAWEAVLYCGARIYPDGSDPERRNALVAGSRARLTDPRHVIGAKPSAFVWWMFRLLGVEIGDTMDDLYPGSGGVGRAWEMLQTSPEYSRDGSGGSCS